MRHAAPRMRVRRGRVAAAMASSTTVVVTVLGASGLFGVQPLETPSPAASSETLAEQRSRAVVDRGERLDDALETPEPNSDPVDDSDDESNDETENAENAENSEDSDTPDATPLPLDSGSGKRVVYTLKDNHVWLVNRKDEVIREYPVSGTKFGQVDPNTYSVIRKRPETTSYHGTETMRYMVTFTEGENAAIGFHDIPISIDSGEPVQTKAQLGTSLSDGCVRQQRADARALWEFAPIGTTVVVLP